LIKAITAQKECPRGYNILYYLLVGLFDLAKKDISMRKAFGDLACPVCGRPVLHTNVDPDTMRVSCNACHTVASVENAQITAKQGLKPSDKKFESFHLRWNPDGCHVYQYDVFISYRNQPRDSLIAGQLADLLTAKGLRVFFAPESLWMENALDKKGDWPTQWVGELKHALLTSAHYVVVLSPHFFTSTHCELELRSIHEICSQNPKRRHWLRLLSLEKEDLHEEIESIARSDDALSLANEVAKTVARAGIRLGVDSIEPTDCFSRLPLTTQAWGEGRPFDPDPPYSQFENVVRELLLLALRGGGYIESALRISKEMAEETHGGREEGGFCAA
jgi:hypothetical protein